MQFVGGRSLSNIVIRNAQTEDITNRADNTQKAWHIIGGTSMVPNEHIITTCSSEYDELFEPLPHMIRPVALLDGVSSTAFASNVIRHELDAQRVAFWHAAFGSPPISTLHRALQRGYLRGIPQFTDKMLMANMPNSKATARGHLDMTRQGQHSTKPNSVSSRPATVITPTVEEILSDEEDRSDVLLLKLFPMADINHSDLTGRFPVTSRKGNNYLLVSTYHGYIHCEAMISRQQAQYIKAFSATLDHFQSLGHSPQYQRCDNETSKGLEDLLRTRGLTVQYVAPSDHRGNRAERAIRDVKNTLIAMLGSADPQCPADLWDEMIFQASLSLNLTRPCSTRPELSAYEAIHGKTFDFVAHPIAPFGTQVLIHESPDKRASWASHGVSGFYLGPAMDHRRCFRVYAVQTQAVRISRTLAWFSETYTVPGSSVSELLYAGISDMTAALRSINTDGQQEKQQALETIAEATATLFRATAAMLGHKPSRDLEPSSVRRHTVGRIGDSLTGLFRQAADMFASREVTEIAAITDATQTSQPTALHPPLQQSSTPTSQPTALHPPLQQSSTPTSQPAALHPPLQQSSTPTSQPTALHPPLQQSITPTSQPAALHPPLQQSSTPTSQPAALHPPLQQSSTPTSQPAALHPPTQQSVSPSRRRPSRQQRIRVSRRRAAKQGVGIISEGATKQGVADKLPERITF
jgi:hypothetical protein